MATLSFRTAVPEDAPVLVTIINLAFRAEKTGQTWLYDDQERRKDLVDTDLILGAINSTDTVILVGTSNGKLLMTCHVNKPQDAPHRTSGAAWMALLAVAPDQHRHGYGLAMLQEMERFVAKEWATKRVEFDFVNTRSELRAWYEKHGYRVTGKRRPFHYGKDGHEVLAPNLEMLVLGKDL